VRPVERRRPRHHRRQDERVLERELHAERATRHLRDRAIPSQQCAHARERFLVTARRTAGSREQREEGHRPAALLHEQREGGQLLVGHAVGLRREGDLDRTATASAQHARQGAQLISARQTTGQRPTLVTDVIGEDGRRESERAGADRVVEQAGHPRDLVRARRAIEGGSPMT
jgi:hypothetical protein